MKNRQTFHRKPRLEALEDRLLMAGLIDNWIGSTTNNSWFVAGNWDKGVVPGAGDTVILGANSIQSLHLLGADGNPKDATVATLKILPTYGTSTLFLGTSTLTVTDDFGMNGGEIAGNGGKVAVQNATVLSGESLRSEGHVEE